MRPLTILLTCRDLVLRGGVQLYTRDLAQALRARGHRPLVYTPMVGEVAEEVRAHAVPVAGTLDAIAETPDVIHGQHHIPAMAAMLHFAHVPALFVCHGWLPWEEAPPKFPTLRHYVAVDDLRRDRLTLEHGIAREQVTTIGNFVDVARFAARAALPPKPRHALLFSNQAGERDAWTDAVRAASADAGLTLDIVGLASGNVVADPSQILHRYDVVFARGRSALEAMATGAAVILCDQEGSGPLVTSANFAALRAQNFGVGVLERPIDAGRLTRELAAYDAEDAAKVRDLVRTDATRDRAVDRFIAVYEGILATTPRFEGDAHLRACLEASARYSAWLQPFVDQNVAARMAGLQMRVRELEDELARHKEPPSRQRHRWWS